MGWVDFDLARPLYREHVARYREYIESGRHAEMSYLERGIDRRENPHLVFPDLESVIVVLSPYSAAVPTTPTHKVARYLNGGDYHTDLKTRLERCVEKLQLPEYLGSTFKAKICVDTSAVLEKAWAELCGLGWIGKNTLLIHPQWGSYVFIGVLFTNWRSGAGPRLVPNYCGSCERCLTACPTQALIAPQVLSSERCISYRTLEHRGEYAESLPHAEYLAGCDICQEVCPFNSKRTRRDEPIPLAAYLDFSLEEAWCWDEATYRARIRGTAFSRIKYADFRRNVLAVLGKS